MKKLISKQEINKIVKYLETGKIVAFPTETVYGLAVIYDSEDAYNNLMIVKERPERKVFTLMCSSIQMVKRIATVNNKLEQLMKTVTPGPITLIIPKNSNLNNYLSEDNSVGVRIPNDEFILNLISIINKPLLVTSANISGTPPCQSVAEIEQKFAHKIDLIVEGSCVSNIPSTIVKIKSDNYKIIRQGEFSEKEFKRIWSDIYD